MREIWKENLIKNGIRKRESEGEKERRDGKKWIIGIQKRKKEVKEGEITGINDTQGEREKKRISCEEKSGKGDDKDRMSGARRIKEKRIEKKYYMRTNSEKKW